MVRSMAMLVAVALGMAGMGRKAQAACTLERLAELPVTMMGRRPIVPAKINGVDVEFVADSGAFFSSISPGSARQLRLPLSPAPFGYTMTGVGGDVVPLIATVRQFILLKSAIPDVHFLVGGSEMIAPAIGLLGQNVLGGADVEYDFANGAIRLFQARGCGRLVLPYWASGKPFSLLDIEGMDDRNRHTIGTARVNGKTLRVTFDTGAGSSIMSLEAAARAGIRTHGPGVTFGGYSSGIGRHLVKSWIAPVDSFQIADEEIKKTKLRIGEISIPGSDMLLGADFFLSHRVYVANGQRKLYFTYNGGPVFDLSASSAPQLDDQVAQTTPEPAGKAGADTGPDADGLSRRGAALAGRGDEAAAIADFTRAIALAPEEPRYLLQRATARLEAHQPALALADLDAMMKLAPDDPQARLMRAGLRLAGHDRDAAREDLDAADKALPREANLRLELAELYLELDDFHSAIAQFDLWIGTHEDDRRVPQALNGRCWARAEADEGLDQALADCNRAVRQSVVKARPLDSRGFVYLRRGELARAVADYDAALAIQPKLAWSLYGRGVAELKSGDKARGAADLAAAAAVAPELAGRAAKLGVTP